MARAMDLTSETMRYQSFRTTLRALSFMATSPTWRTAEQLHSRRRACRFSWNLRHVLNNHMVANHETNPPTYSRAIDILTPIYARIEDALNAAGILMYTAPDFQWQVNTEGIRQDFNSLMAHWHDYMTHQQLVYRTKYVQVTDSLHEVEDHLNSLKAIRMSCRTERSRIHLANITYQLAWTRLSQFSCTHTQEQTESSHLVCSIHITDSGPYGQHVRVQPGPAFCGTRNCVICRRHLGLHNQFTTCGKCYLAATAAQHLEGVDFQQVH